MISLDQIRQLEAKVHAAVATIQTLRTENHTLKGKLESYERRIEDLQHMVDAFKSDQAEIERGIVSALERLDALEDAVSESALPDTTGAVPTPPEDPAPSTGEMPSAAAPTAAETDRDAGGEPTALGESSAPRDGAPEPLPEADGDEDTDEDLPAEDEPELDIF